MDFFETPPKKCMDSSSPSISIGPGRPDAAQQDNEPESQETMDITIIGTGNMARGIATLASRRRPPSAGWCE